MLMNKIEEEVIDGLICKHKYVSDEYVNNGKVVIKEITIIIAKYYDQECEEENIYSDVGYWIFNQEYLHCNPDEVKLLHCRGDKCRISFGDMDLAHCESCYGDFDIEKVSWYLLKDQISYDNINKEDIIEEKITDIEMDDDKYNSIIESQKLKIKVSNYNINYYEEKIEKLQHKIEIEKNTIKIMEDNIDEIKNYK